MKQFLFLLLSTALFSACADVNEQNVVLESTFTQHVTLAEEDASISTNEVDDLQDQIEFQITKEENDMLIAFENEIACWPEPVETRTTELICR